MHDQKCAGSNRIFTPGWGFSHEGWKSPSKQKTKPSGVEEKISSGIHPDFKRPNTLRQSSKMNPTETLVTIRKKSLTGLLLRFHSQSLVQCNCFLSTWIFCGSTRQLAVCRVERNRFDVQVEILLVRVKSGGNCWVILQSTVGACARDVAVGVHKYDININSGHLAVCAIAFPSCPVHLIT